MKRTSLISTTIFAALTTASVAHAGGDLAKPATIWIPTADVTLQPSGLGDCMNVSMSADVSSALCTGAVDEETVREPHPDADAIVTGVTDALAAYNINIVTEAPPEYLPAFLILPSDVEAEESFNSTCTGAGLTCAARGRDSVGFTNGGTENCTDPDIVQQTLYAIGRMSGLEGKEDATDAMVYPPDYTAPVAEFVDSCGPISPFLGGDKGDMPLPLECTSADHAGDCDAGDQNSHADLLEYYGAAGDDTDAPTITATSPEDGGSIEEGGALTVSADFTDDSNYIGMRYLIESEALAADTDNFPLGNITFCTTDICDVNFLEGEPFKTADSSWATPDISGLPGGDYTITIEASDYAGNVAESVVISVTLEGGPVDPTDSGDTMDPTGDTMDPTGDTMDPTGDTNDTGFATQDGDSSGGGDTDGGDGGAGGDDGGGGCHVGPAQKAGSTFVLLLGLLGLGVLRRRK